MSPDDLTVSAGTAVLARASAAAACARSDWLAPLRGLRARLARRTADPWLVPPSRRLRRALLRSGLFDAGSYAADADLGGLAGDPLRHFISHGFAEARRPNLLFDPLWYLDRNPDVLREGINPLLHYVRTGEREGRRPHPLFDPNWYARAYPDVDGRGGLLRHYLHHGRAEGRSPSAEFDPQAYLQANPDLPDLGAETLRHYLEHGMGEGRRLRLPPPPPPPETSGSLRLAYGPGADGLPRYRLEPGAPAYTYVPPAKPADLAAHMEALGRRPRFSIVTPVYNVAPALLEACVGSVVQQWWPHWELILVDDCSPKAATRSYLRELSHPQVAVEFSPVNEGISGATNRALARATGDYVVFLDNDDELTPDCLWELAQRIAATDADYVYSDEDKLSPEGAYVDPFFKPDWSPDAFMSTMYTCHVSCVRRSLVDEVGRLRPAFDGAQDYDLILRVTEKARRIEHVPRVLYHWRILPTSTAGAIEAKPYAISAAKRCKEDALERRGLMGEVEAVERMPGQFRMSYQVQGDRTVSIVIPSRNNHAILRQCLASILSVTNYQDFEIILVDNGSSNVETLLLLDELRSDPRVLLLHDQRTFNYSELNNIGAGAASGRFLLFLNDDTEVIQSDWLGQLAGYAQLSHVGAVGAKLLYSNGTVQHAGVSNLISGPAHMFWKADPDLPDHFGRHLLEYDWIAVTGACLMVERSKFNALGGFDTDLPIAYNDVDFCFRLLDAGLFNVVCQAVRVIHHESLSRGHDTDPVKAQRLKRDWRRLYKKHPQRLGVDPFHNSHLHPRDTYYSATL